MNMKNNDVMSTTFFPLYAASVMAFQLSEDDYRRTETTNAMIPVGVVKVQMFSLANPVIFRVTPLTIDDAIARGIISETDPRFQRPTDDVFSPSRAGTVHALL